MVTRRMGPAQGQCPGFPASTVPGENRAAKSSFQDLGQEPTAGHHLSRHATPSRADLESALEDVRRSCSNSGRGHNPRACPPPAMCSEPTGFSRAMGQRGHLPSSRPISLPALSRDGPTQRQQGSQSAVSPGVGRNGASEWELLPTTLTGHGFNTPFWNSAFNSKCLLGQIWSLESNYRTGRIQNTHKKPTYLANRGVFQTRVYLKA